MAGPKEIMEEGFGDGRDQLKEWKEGGQTRQLGSRGVGLEEENRARVQKRGKRPQERSG